MRPRASEAKWRRITKFGHACPYCARPFSREVGTKRSPTKDHVTPAWLGGRWWVWVCWQCNNDKGAMPVQAWHALLTQRGDERAAVVGAFVVKHAERVIVRRGF